MSIILKILHDIGKWGKRGLHQSQALKLLAFMLSVSYYTTKYTPTIYLLNLEVFSNETSLKFYIQTGLQIIQWNLYNVTKG